MSIKGCSSFWEAKLQHDRFLLEPGTEALIKETIGHLNNYQTLLGRVEAAKVKVRKEQEDGSNS